MNGKTPPRPLNTFILENRDLYRFLLREWLEGQNGHPVTMFDSAESLHANAEARDLELLAVHLLPSGMPFPRDHGTHTHAVYGDGLDASSIFWCVKTAFADPGSREESRIGPSAWKASATVSAELPPCARFSTKGLAKGYPD